MTTSACFRALVHTVAIGLACTLVAKTGHVQPVLGAPASQVSVLFRREALSLPVLTTTNPLLRITHVRRAGLYRCVRALQAEAQSRHGGKTKLAPSLSDAIAAGYSSGELKLWRQDQIRYPQYELELWETYKQDVVVGHSAIEQAYRTLQDNPILKRIYARYRRTTGDLAQHAAAELDTRWLLATVESPYRYLLGYQPNFLALDLLIFLEQLQDSGEAKDSHGRIITSLSDDQGKPYRHLSTEYILHERFSGTSLSHDEIIQITTEAFGYGLYRPTLQKHSNGESEVGANVFTRPGQTPLGIALRSFVAWRFEERVRSLIGSLVAISFFDPSFANLLSINGRAVKLVFGQNSEALLRVFDEGNDEVDIPLASIVEFDSIEDLLILPKSASMTLDDVLSHLQAGIPVSLTVRQLRSMIGPATVTHPLCELFDALLTCRDNEAIRLYAGVRLDPNALGKALLLAVQLGRALAAMNIQLFVHNIIFNSPNPLHEPGFFWYQGMPALDAYDYTHTYLQEISEEVLIAVVRFTCVTLSPSYNGGAISLSAHRATVKAPQATARSA